MSLSAIEMDPRAADEARKLQPRLIKGMQADYEPVFWDGRNLSGLIPYGPNVLVCMDRCSSVSSGGILLPDVPIDAMNEASVTGCIYAMGPEAFHGLVDRPQIGDRIYIEKYAGTKARGKDGLFYRVLDDSCVVCGIDLDATQVEG
jgi:co-chaperonin GroES (HSP10)